MGSDVVAPQELWVVSGWRDSNTVENCACAVDLVFGRDTCSRKVTGKTY